MAALPPGDGEGGSGGGGGKESKGKEKVVEEYGKNRHGQPVGFYMVPSDLELIRMLRCKLLRGKLPGALNDVFHELRILDFHPAVLYSMYEKRMEDDYIYFFSRREYPAKAGRNKRRPVRATNGGTWKASGGSKTVETKKGGRDVAVGQRLTMVFYERRLGGDKKAESVKTNWGMHEFCKFIPGSKNKELEDLAVYRLYKMGRKEEEQEAEEDEEVVEPSTSASTEIPPQLPPAPQLLLELAGSSPPILALPPPEGFDEWLAATALPLQQVAPGLAGGMMSMADQANVGSTSQPYAASQTGTELMEEERETFENSVLSPLSLTSPDLAGSSSPILALPPLEGFDGWFAATALPLQQVAPGLAGGMMSMADQSNVTSTSQPYAASRRGSDLMEEEDWEMVEHSDLSPLRLTSLDLAGSSSLILPLPPPEGFDGWLAASALPLQQVAPGLAGGMMSMADQSNVASTSQPYAASRRGTELMEEEDWAMFDLLSPLSLTSPDGLLSPGEPMDYDDYLQEDDTTDWPLNPLIQPLAVRPPEPDTTGQNSPAPASVDHQLSPPQGAAAADDYSSHQYGLVDYGVLQDQQEPQADGGGAAAMADGDAQQGSPSTVAPWLDLLGNFQRSDGDLIFRFDDGTELGFDKFCHDEDTGGEAEEMLIDGGCDAAHGGDGGCQGMGGRRDVDRLRRCRRWR